MPGLPIIRQSGVFGTPKLPRTLRVGPKSRSVNLNAQAQSWALHSGFSLVTGRRCCALPGCTEFRHYNQRRDLHAQGPLCPSASTRVSVAGREREREREKAMAPIRVDGPVGLEFWGIGGVGGQGLSFRVQSGDLMLNLQDMEP